MDPMEASTIILRILLETKQLHFDNYPDSKNYVEVVAKAYKDIYVSVAQTPRSTSEM